MDKEEERGRLVDACNLIGSRLTRNFAGTGIVFFIVLANYEAGAMGSATNVAGGQQAIALLEAMLQHLRTGTAEVSKYMVKAVGEQD